jgi:hypothetical protein
VGRLARGWIGARIGQLLLCELAKKPGRFGAVLGLKRAGLVDKNREKSRKIDKKQRGF